MALNYGTNPTFAGRITAPDANYPQGSSKDETSPGANDGMPYIKQRADDILGMQQALLFESGITPSGSADTALQSDYLNAMKKILKSGRKNALLGNFRINQRGVSGSVVLAAGVYGHDRFKAGAGGCSYTFAISAGVTTITISAGTLVQVVEGDSLESADYVLSWQGTAQGQINGGGFGDSGEVTATLVGAANATVEFNTGTLALPQLEKGSVATEFEHRPIALELWLCQRYYYELPVTENVEGTWGNAISNATVTVILPAVMRGVPTVSATTNFVAGTIQPYLGRVFFNAVGTVTQADVLVVLTFSADAEL